MATTTIPAAGPETAGIDHAIQGVESLYRAVTGKEPPPSIEPHAPFPVEKDPAAVVEEQLERLLTLLEERTGTTPVPPWSPLLTVFDSDDEITVLVDLPGVERKDIELVLEANILTLRGRRAAPPAIGQRSRLVERPTGPFARRVVLAPDLRLAEPKAQLRDGVLEIRLTKETPSRISPHTVQIH